METRGRNVSVNYSNPPQFNQESSLRLTTSPASHTRTNETTDHLHHHGFKLQKQKLEPQRPRMNQNLDPAGPVSQPPTHSTITRPVVTVVVRYRECLKNHAANKGTHVLDGCGEFMPGGEDDTPEALKCAACECHRSFHRREVEGESQSGYHTHNPTPRIAAVQIPQAPLSQQQQHRYHHHPRPPTPIMMAFGGAPAESSSEDLNIFQSYAQTSKKRFRTKFTQEQKDKMHDFAERVGWKIQKQDEQDVLRFCNQVGLKKQVFKVWMHNNKPATKKNQL